MSPGANDVALSPGTENEITTNEITGSSSSLTNQSSSQPANQNQDELIQRQQEGIAAEIGKNATCPKMICIIWVKG